MKTTFISHATEDHSTASRICERLEREGIPCWIAPRDILEGEQWPDAVMRGLAECNVLVLVFSAHSNSSTWVIRELEKAASMSKTVIPVRVEDVKPNQRISFFVGLEQWLDASQPPIDAHIERLVRAIRKHGEHQVSNDGGDSSRVPVVTVPVARRRRTWRSAFALAGVVFAGLMIFGIVWFQSAWSRKLPESEIELFVECQMKAKNAQEQLAKTSRTPETGRILDRAELSWLKAEAFHQRGMTRQAMAQYEAVISAAAELEAMRSAQASKTASANPEASRKDDQKLVTKSDPAPDQKGVPRTTPARSESQGVKASMESEPKANLAPPKLGKVVVNSIGVPMVYIASGNFTMGSPTREWTQVKDERQAQVTISRDFWIAATETTKGQFSQFVSQKKHRTSAEIDGHAWVSKDGIDNIKETGLSWKNPGFPQGDNDPVVCVSWRDATAFCEWLSTKEGQTYRLPTEAEWEFVCRAGTTSPYVTGSIITTDDANYNGETPNYKATQGTFRGRTTQVRTFEPNAWGVFDMHGNVWEWCSDWYEPEYKGGRDPRGPLSGEHRVRRGGSFVSSMELLRSAFRSKGREDRAYPITGFRIVRDVE